MDAADACGVAPADGVGRFLVTTGLGHIVEADVSAKRLTRLASRHGTAWDNHLSAPPI